MSAIQRMSKYGVLLFLCMATGVMQAMDQTQRRSSVLRACSSVSCQTCDMIQIKIEDSIAGKPSYTAANNSGPLALAKPSAFFVLRGKKKTLVWHFALEHKPDSIHFAAAVQNLCRDLKSEGFADAPCPTDAQLLGPDQLFRGLRFKAFCVVVGQDSPEGRRDVFTALAEFKNKIDSSISPWCLSMAILLKPESFQLRQYDLFVTTYHSGFFDDIILVEKHQESATDSDVESLLMPGKHQFRLFFKPLNQDGLWTYGLQEMACVRKDDRELSIVAQKDVLCGRPAEVLFFFSYEDQNSYKSLCSSSISFFPPSVAAPAPSAAPQVAGQGPAARRRAQRSKARQRSTDGASAAAPVAAAAAPATTATVVGEEPVCASHDPSVPTVFNDANFPLDLPPLVSGYSEHGAASYDAFSKRDE